MSSNEAIFIAETKDYQEALQKSGHKYTLKLDPQAAETKNRRKTEREKSNFSTSLQYEH